MKKTLIVIALASTFGVSSAFAVEPVSNERSNTKPNVTQNHTCQGGNNCNFGGTIGGSVGNSVGNVSGGSATGVTGSVTGNSGIVQGGTSSATNNGNGNGSHSGNLTIEEGAFQIGPTEIPTETTQNIHYSGTQTIKNVPNVDAPALTSSNDTCMGSTSGGVAVAGFGFSLGSTWTDKNCTMLKNSRELWNMGMRAASMARMCMDSENHEALELTGFTCPTKKEDK
jgi:hypothetical protein